MTMYRQPQQLASFSAGTPARGYYNDLRDVARSYGSAGEAAGWLLLFARRREQALPVSLLQLGLGAWQLADDGERDWLEVVRLVARWALFDMDGHGRFAHLQPMQHTYPIAPPWHSAMAQGQALSLLVRAATALDDPHLLQDACRAAQPLLDHSLGLVARTDQGPVLQEYPTEPPSHVLNGWIWGLWGLFDLAACEAAAAGPDAAVAFDDGVAALAARLHLYELDSGWTRYDLYPHPVTNVASPFYHQLHIAQLAATAELARFRGLDPVADLLGEAATRWQAAFDRRSTRYAAVVRKVGFRLVRPRRRSVA